MRATRNLIVLATLAALAPACKSWPTLPDHTISIVAVERVGRTEEFTFTVHIKDASGQPIKKMDYQYKIDWVGVEGSTHKAKSGILESIRAKGGAGSATLHVLGYDAKGQWGTVAKHAFEVQ